MSQDARMFLAGAVLGAGAVFIFVTLASTIFDSNPRMAINVTMGADLLYAAGALWLGHRPKRATPKIGG